MSAEHAVVHAQVHPTPLAVVAGSAAYIRGYGDPVAHGKPAHRAVYFHHGAGYLMAHDLALCPGAQADVEVADVRTAQAAGLDPDDHAAGVTDRIRNVPDNDSLDVLEDRRPH
jgi:hypothetical protein